MSCDPDPPGRDVLRVLGAFVIVVLVALVVWAAITQASSTGGRADPSLIIEPKARP